jgi:hypothetical protein
LEYASRKSALTSSPYSSYNEGANAGSFGIGADDQRRFTILGGMQDDGPGVDAHVKTSIDE